MLDVRKGAAACGNVSVSVRQQEQALRHSARRQTWPAGSGDHSSSRHRCASCVSMAAGTVTHGNDDEAHVSEREWQQRHRCEWSTWQRVWRWSSICCHIEILLQGNVKAGRWCSSSGHRCAGHSVSVRFYEKMLAMIATLSAPPLSPAALVRPTAGRQRGGIRGLRRAAASRAALN